MVDSLEIIEVVSAVRQLGGVHAVDEIVVGRERDGLQSAGLQLDADTAAEGGLATTARSCNQHQTHRVLAMIAAVDLLGDLHNLLLLEGLGHLHQLPRHPAFAGMVDVAHRAQSHDVIPLQTL